MSDVARRQRAERRRERATVTRVDPGSRQSDTDEISGIEGLSLVAELTEASWSLARLPWPTYSRAEIPVRFVPGWPE